MLEQIIRDMHVDPELLNELSDEQKEILFCAIRQEQVRRYEEWQRELEKGCDRSPVRPSTRRKFRKQPVRYLCGEDGEPIVHVINEVELEKPSAVRAHAKAVAARLRRESSGVTPKSAKKKETRNLCEPDILLERLCAAGLDTEKVLPRLLPKPAGLFENFQKQSRNVTPQPETSPPKQMTPVPAQLVNTQSSPLKTEQVVKNLNVKTSNHLTPEKSPQKRVALVFEPEVPFPRIEDLKAQLKYDQTVALKQPVYGGANEVVIRNRCEPSEERVQDMNSVNIAAQYEESNDRKRFASRPLQETEFQTNYVLAATSQQYELLPKSTATEFQMEDEEGPSSDDQTSCEADESDHERDETKNNDVFSTVVGQTRISPPHSSDEESQWLTNTLLRARQEESRKRRATSAARRSLCLDEGGYGGGEFAFERRQSSSISAHKTSDEIKKRQEALASLQLEQNAQGSVLDWIRKYEAPRLMREFRVPVYYDHLEPSEGAFRYVPTWFHGVISRACAERMLFSANRNGGFLLRVSDSFLGFVISLLCGGKCHHSLISIIHRAEEREPNTCSSSDGRYKLFGHTENVSFARLPDLVDYYSCHSLSVLDDQMLLHPVGQPEHLFIPDYVDLFYPQAPESMDSRF